MLSLYLRVSKNKKEKNHSLISVIKMGNEGKKGNVSLISVEGKRGGGRVKGGGRGERKRQG